MRNPLILILLLLSVAACTSKDYTVDEQDRICILTKNPEKKGVRITVLKDNIIKVESSATTKFDTTKSLVAIDSIPSENYELNENEKEVIITTKGLIVRVAKETGQIFFYDSKNQLILNESKNGSEFDPVTVNGITSNSLRQQFDSPEDEALYGLGQHQVDEINYKGKNEELFQYNTKVSVPFIISTRKYGVLWDNYSFSRFGDPRPYSNLNQFRLFDLSGHEGGLTATYIFDKNGKKDTVRREETRIDYENLETIHRFPESVDFNHATVTWEGSIQADENGIYRFLCYYAGYTKLWLDGELQVDRWRTSWNPSVAKFTTKMQVGEKHTIKLEWIPDGGVSYIGLKALSPVDPKEQKNLSFYSEMGKNIRYYFMYGNSMDDVISHYRTISGKAQVMPKWAMGFWQSRERYKTQSELVEVLKEFRQRHIPIDNIVLDWSYWPQDKWGSHDFDTNRFPDVRKMVNTVHDENAHIMISVWPKFYKNTTQFKAYDEHHWMYKQAVYDSIKDWIGKGYIGSFYDAYNPEARKLFWQQIKDKLYVKGFDAWWLDATEPDILSNASIEYRKKLMDPTALGPSTEYFNAYALMNAKGIYEGQRSLDKDERVFILTRSGFAGIQRYGAVTWSGDIGTRWEDMKAQISAGINFAMSGLPYWTMDVGGFCVEKRYERAKPGSEDMKEWKELNTRWYQFGAFTPLFRVHGQYPYREIFNIAGESEPAYKSMLKYNKLRYRLMPYIYSLAGWTYTKDYTIMRGLAMDFTNDKKVRNIGDQYMFGPALMVCPVYEYGAHSRNVYFPGSEGWYNANTGEFIVSSQEISVEAPYEDLPLFIRAGSILPIGPEIEYTDEKPADPITLVIYRGKNGSFDLYEDEGDNYKYEKGHYSNIPISWSEINGTLTIGKRTGDYKDMLEKRTFRVILADRKNKISLVDLSTLSKFDQEIHYDGSPVTVSLK